MRILVDASAAFEQGAGIGRYSRSLLSRVIPLMPWDAWTLFRTRDGRCSSYVSADQFPAAHARTVTAPFSRRRADQVWHRLRAPLDVRLLTGKADLVYSPDFTAPPAFGVPRIVTVHDLAFLTHPEHTTPALRRYLGMAVPREVKRATHLIAVSEATRSDLISMLNVAPWSVTVVRNAVDRRFFDAGPLSQEQRERLQLPTAYLLMLGTIEPRKNHDTVFRVIQQLDRSLEIPLVIAGRPGWGCDDTMRTARQLQAQGKAILLNYVAEDDLPSLIASASIVLYPSWTEGFGLPVIEALAAGTPVIAGNAPALREAGGHVATFVDPGSDEQLLEAIRRELQHPSHMTQREDRKQWARGFDWSDSALSLMRVLQGMERHRHG